MVKRIQYTQHAEERLKMRSISKKLIEDAISNPDESFKKNNFKIIHKFLGEKLLRVFLRKEEDLIVLLSAYITYKRRYVK